MRVILHIGMEKTGTSSIQEFLLQNKNGLSKLGYYYLHMNGRNEYRAFPAYCMDKSRSDEYFRRNRVTDRKARESFDNNYLACHRQKLESIPEHIHTVIISSEHLSSRLKSREEVCRVKQLMELDFSSVQIVCYLRDQVAKVCSGYSTRIKTGGFVLFNEHFTGYIKGTCDDYDRKLALWEGVFGYENILVRLFDRSCFTGGTLLSDFFNILDETLFDKLDVPIKTRNVSLSRLGCEVMRRVNYLFPKRIRGIQFVEDFRASIIRVIIKFIKGDPVRLTAEQAEQIRQRFRSSNERVRDRYFPDRTSLF